jgi:D-aminopeptidase
MEATEEAILNSMCMAGPMTGINGNHCPALPLDEVRRFAEAVRPALGQRRRPTGPQGPPVDSDREGTVKVADAVPTAVRGAEGIPFPTRPPDSSDWDGSD